MASGMPSRVRQSRATAAALSVLSAKPGPRRGGPVGEQPDRLVPRVVQGQRVRAGGTASGGTRHTVSPRTRSGSRLVAITRRHRAAGQQLANQFRRPVDQVLAGVENEQQLAPAEGVDQGGRSAAGRAPRGRRRTRPPAAGRAPVGASASSTSQAPSGKSGTRSQASRSASRVLPMPPGPHSVSARTSLSSSASSARSRSRPTKLFGSAGRLPEVGAAEVMAWGPSGCGRECPTRPRGSCAESEQGPCWCSGADRNTSV